MNEPAEPPVPFIVDGKPTELLTVAEIAKMLHVSGAFICTEVRAGRLAAYRVGRAIRISRAALEAYLNLPPT